MLGSLTSACLSPEKVIRLSPLHADQVQALATKTTELLFGDKTALTHINEHFLSLAITDDSDSIVGAICLDSFPNIPSIPPWEFLHWLRNLYGIDDVQPRTVLWAHYTVYDRRYALIFLPPLLQFFFQQYEEMEKVIFVVPPGIARVDILEQVATRVLPIGFVNPRTVQTLYVINKDPFVCHYTIRRAVEEDNDDLIAIIPKILEETYGPYYIAEILGLPDCGRRLIVAEHKGCAVGVLCMNEMVNYDLLNEHFELVVYNGFRKPNEDDEVMSQQLSTAGFAVWNEENEPQSELAVERVSVTAQSGEAEDVTDTHSEDDYSLFNISSSLLLRYLYDDSPQVTEPMAKASRDSLNVDRMSTEDYADHIYSTDRDQEVSIIRFTQSKNVDSPIPTFRGEANAFSLEICAALNDHENCLYLLFQAAFESFPDRDYCIVSFPAVESCGYITKHFARVMHRTNTYFPNELYILHRNAIMGELWARVGVEDDADGIEELIHKLGKQCSVLEMFLEAVLNPDIEWRAYVFLCESQIVGCAILNAEKEFNYLKAHYWIDPWVNNTSCKLGPYGAIECFLLSPMFQRHQAFFVRELHRLGHFYILFYRLKKTDFLLAHRTIPIVNAIQVMAPVIMKTKISYNKAMMDEYNFPEYLQAKSQVFTLYLTTAKLMSRPVVEINDRIIVVGVGMTSMSFLECLLFNKNSQAQIFFTNLIVITSYDVFAHKTRKIEELIFVNHGDSENQHKDYLWLKSYVQLVTGIMTSIERKEKYIVLNEEAYLSYDYLFLLCGEQFQRPPHKKAHQQRNTRRHEIPNNLFVLNSAMDVAIAFDMLKQMDSKKMSNPIVVFGHYLEAICCLNALLENGYAGSNLVYIDPSPESNPTNARHDHLSQFFNNSQAENAVLEELLNNGITVYQDYNIVDWYYDNETENFITSAKFESKYKFIEIDLMALFVYHSRTVSPRTFQAIIRAGLVFNGHLVIDYDFCTNDPHIFSAGPLTKYSQKYYSEDQMHKYFNSNEIGYELGMKIRKKLVPKEYSDVVVLPASAANTASSMESEGGGLELKMGMRSTPLVQYCRFPGKLHYLQVSKPGRPIPLEVAMNKAHYGKILVTGNTSQLNQQGYFRLHFNQFNRVETITCLSKSEFNVQHLISLYGKHVSLFNQLFIRFEMKMIPCLFEYFEQPWMYAFYHMDFSEMLTELMDLFKIHKVPTSGKTLIEELYNLYDGSFWKKLDAAEEKQFKTMCHQTPIVQAIETRLLDFLNKNLIYLPMYAHHILIRWIIGCNKNNALFHENRHYGEKLPETYLHVKKNRPKVMAAAGGGDEKEVATVENVN